MHIKTFAKKKLKKWEKKIKKLKTFTVHKSNKTAKSKKSNEDSNEDIDEDEDDEEEDGDAAATAIIDKYGVGGIDRPVQRPNRFYGLCPLHIAIEAGHIVS